MNEEPKSYPVIDSDILLAAKFCDTSGVRPILGGVKVTNEEYIATDSYRAIIIKRKTKMTHDDTPQFRTKEKTNGDVGENTVIPAKMLKTLKFPSSRTLPILHTAAILNNTENEITIGVTDLDKETVHTYRKIQGTYPDLQAFYDKQKPKISMKMSGRFMADALSCFKGSVDIHWEDDKAPIIITGSQGEGEEHIRCLVMPVRK